MCGPKCIVIPKEVKCGGNHENSSSRKLKGAWDLDVMEREDVEGVENCGEIYSIIKAKRK